MAASKVGTDFNTMDPPFTITNPSHTSGTTQSRDRFPWLLYAKDDTYVMVQDEAEKLEFEGRGYKDHPWTAAEKKAKEK